MVQQEVVYICVVNTLHAYLNLYASLTKPNTYYYSCKQTLQRKWCRLAILLTNRLPTTMACSRTIC